MDWLLENSEKFESTENCNIYILKLAVDTKQDNDKDGKKAEAIKLSTINRRKARGRRTTEQIAIDQVKQKEYNAKHKEKKRKAAEGGADHEVEEENFNNAL
jgi:hypothetical protein